MGNRSSKKFTINSPVDDKAQSTKSAVESPATNLPKEVENEAGSAGSIKTGVEEAALTTKTDLHTEEKEAVMLVESAVQKEAESGEIGDDKSGEDAKKPDEAEAKTVEDLGEGIKNIGIETNLEISSVEYDGHEIILYYMFMSPPCRSVMLTAKLLGINLKLVECDVLKGDNKTPEFTKINLQQTIPTIDDQGFYLWESRPIMTYLVSKYGKDDSLYPKDDMIRAAVDLKLFFDIGTLYCRLSDYYYPALFHDKELDESQFKRLEEAVDFLNTALTDKTFSACEHLTVADVTLCITVSNLQAVHFDFSKYPNIAPWMERTEKALQPYGYEEINKPAVEWFENIYKNKILNKEEIEKNPHVENGQTENTLNDVDDYIENFISKTNEKHEDFSNSTEESFYTAEGSSENN